MIPELAMNPLMPRIIALCDNANFSQFVRTIAVFGPNSTKQAKTDFAFRVYDVDGDGFSSAADLTQVLHMMVGEDNLDEATTTRIVQKVIDDADTDGDDRISRDEFTLVRWLSCFCPGHRPLLEEELRARARALVDGFAEHRTFLQYANRGVDHSHRRVPLKTFALPLCCR